MSDEAAFEEAFKLKAQQLLGLLSSQSLPADALQEVRALLEQAKTLYKEKKMEDAALKAAQALMRARKG